MLFGARCLEYADAINGLWLHFNDQDSRSGKREPDALQNSFRHLPVRPTESSIDRVAHGMVIARKQMGILSIELSQSCIAGSCELKLECCQYQVLHTANICLITLTHMAGVGIYPLSSPFTCCVFLSCQARSVRCDLICPTRAGQSSWKEVDGSSICDRQTCP